MKKLFSWKYSDNSMSFALLVLRLTVGALMIPHGYNKLVNFASMSAKFVDPFHIGTNATVALVVFAEFFCAVFIVLGLMTRLATIPLIISMAIALWLGHQWKIFGEGQNAALFLGGYIALLFAGPGKVSMDRLIGK